MKDFYYRSLLLFVFVIQLPCFLSAQANIYQEGYITLKNGQTVNGLINRKGAADLSEYVIFKHSNESQSDRYSPDQVERFGFVSDGTVFCSIIHQYSNKKEQLKRPRFAKILVEGEVDLYKLYRTKIEKKTETNDSDILYYLKKGGAYFKLEQYESKNKGNSKFANKYVDVLAVLLKDCPSLEAEIREKPVRIKSSFGYRTPEKTTAHYRKTVAFRDEALSSLVAKYIECSFAGSDFALYRGEAKIVTKNVVELGYHNWLRDRGTVFSLWFTRLMELTDEGGNLAWSYGANIYYSPELDIFSGAAKSTLGTIINANGRFYLFRSRSISPYGEIGLSLYLPAGNTVFYFNKRIGVQSNKIALFYSNNSVNLFGVNEAIHQFGIGYNLN